MFLYCGNNPINACDPTGYASITNPSGISSKYSLLPDSGCGCCGGVGGGIEIIYPFVWLVDTFSSVANSFEEWLDSKRTAIVDAVSRSLARSTSSVPNNSTHIHHIVPQNDLRGLPAQIVLQEVFPDLGVDDPRNLIPVSERIHVRLHTNLYYDLVNCAITIAYLAAGDSVSSKVTNVEAALEGLKIFITVLESL